MATRITDYDPSITEPSRLELLNIARWLQDNKKTTYLVGGWAVYYYTKPRERPSAKLGELILGKSRLGDPHGFGALGSKDIDLVFQNKREKEEFEQQYARSNGYYRRGPFQPKEWVKRAGNTEIILDLDIITNPYKNSVLPLRWNFLPSNSTSTRIEEETAIYTPNKELLLLYKCVALVERTDERRKPNAEVIRLDSKIWKDANDILALQDTEINNGTLADLAEKTGLAPILRDAKKIISKNYENYGFTQYSFAKSFLEQ